MADRCCCRRRQIPPDLLKVDKPVDRPQLVVGGYMLLERKLIEQCSLFDLPMSHHDLQSCQLDRLNHCYICVATAAFFNKIDPKRTSQDRLLLTHIKPLPIAREQKF